MKLALLSVLLAIPIFAQDAKVIELSTADATRAKLAYESLQKAQTEWDAVKKKVSETYLSDPRQLSSSGLTFTIPIKQGWSVGFDFNESFRFIVPKPSTGSEITGTTCFQNFSSVPAFLNSTNGVYADPRYDARGSAFSTVK